MKNAGSTTGFILIALTFWLPVNALNTCVLSGQGTANLNQGQSKESETDVFNRYYQALVLLEDIPKALDLAQNYIDQFPDGPYAAYLKVWVKAINKRAEIERGGIRPGELATTASGGQAQGSDAMLRALIEEGMDINLKLQNGKTMLMLAAETGQTDLVKALMLRGANVNAKAPKGGWTALFYAIRQMHANTVQALIDGGADVNIKDADEASPLEIAIINGDPEILRLLRKAGARQ